VTALGTIAEQWSGSNGQANGQLPDFQLDEEVQSLLRRQTQDEHDGLKEQIRESKYVVPLDIGVVKGERVLCDGYSRWDICRELGIDPHKIPTRDIAFKTRDEMLEWVIKNQFNRRNATKEDRQTAVAQLRARGKSTRQIAETLHVPQSTVQDDVVRARKSQTETPKGDNSAERNRSVENEGPKPTPEPAKVTGKDGKQRRARMPSSPKPRSQSGKPIVSIKDVTDKLGVLTRALNGLRPACGATPQFKACWGTLGKFATELKDLGKWLK
jgi:transposase-like protein